MLGVKQHGIKYHFFESLVWLDLGLNSGFPDHLQTLPLQSNSCKATYLSSHKPSMKDDQDMMGTAAEVRTNLSSILSWTTTHGYTSVCQPAKTCIYQYCLDTVYSLEDLLTEIADLDRWERERERECQENPCYQDDLMMVMIMMMTRNDEVMISLRKKLGGVLLV